MSQGLSRTLVDRKLSVGAEMELYHEMAIGNAAEVSFVVSPSMQWRPTESAHLDVAPLIGCTHESPRIELYVVFGIDFGTEGHQNRRYAPASLRGQ